MCSLGRRMLEHLEIRSIRHVRVVLVSYCSLDTGNPALHEATLLNALSCGLR